ncbi:hypothetical protein LTR87_004224 [Friedmanniomyces endolithicus]|nr:hypothetical protein LTR87_004224 [Friedmanniomyces endolithicus]
MSTMQTRQPSSKEQTVIDQVVSLYQCRPSEEAYSHYREDAVFHDPFNGMPKLFERSDTQKLEVLDDQKQPNAIVLNLTQHYVFKGSSTPEKTLNSKITLKMDSNGMIEHHEEEWDHKPNKTGEDGFMGKIQQWRKEASAKMVEMGVSSDTKKI